MWKRYNPKSFLSEPQKIAAALDARSLPWRVSDVMKSKIGSVDQDAELGTAAGLMRDDNVGLLPVVDADRRVVGCITDRDLVVRNPAPESLVQIKDVMSTDVACVTMDQSLDDVLDIMAARKVRRVPVVDGVRHLLGAVSVSDVIERSQNDKSLQKALARLSEPHN